MLPETGAETLNETGEGAGGIEWLIDATGCDRARLRDRAALEGLFDALIQGMHLHPVAPAAWHQFPGPGGITGVSLLAESHLACHTFPENGSMCLNVFCCKEREEPAWAALLRIHLGAGKVSVTRVRRIY